MQHQINQNKQNKHPAKIKQIYWWLFIILLLICCWLILVTSFILWVGSKQNLVKADAIVVLGAAAYHNKPSPVFEERIKHGINLYQQKYASKIIFTGGFGKNAKFAEAQVALFYALNNGVLPTDILIETNSHNTFENLYEAQKILKANNLNSIIIVSDPLHMVRALNIAKKLDINAQSSATPSTKFKSIKTSWRFWLQEVYFFHHHLFVQLFNSSS